MLMDPKAFLAHIRLDALLATAATSSIVVLNHKSSTQSFILSWLSSFTKAIVCAQTSQSLYTYCDSLSLSPATRALLYTNLHDSALKMTSNNLLTAKAMLSTTPYTLIIPHTAILCVEELLLAVQLPGWNAFLVQSWQNVLKSCVAIVAASIGAALCSLIDPGVGTVLGAMTGESIVMQTNVSALLLLQHERFTSVFNGYLGSMIK
ncbi:hypothetical protein THRCLA_09663 [Thraustotheca clavata]|uniref:Uncharacterized protein n=1 Tax=Thraustotheca clavata TaxID=74557 RepID=A0A1V9YVK5_9STRA|nr:hypothetical protein THRCLA_09663 [Thraustotheca clavata]